MLTRRRQGMSNAEISVRTTARRLCIMYARSIRRGPSTNTSTFINCVCARELSRLRWIKKVPRVGDGGFYFHFFVTRGSLQLLLRTSNYTDKMINQKSWKTNTHTSRYSSWWREGLFSMNHSWIVGYGGACKIDVDSMYYIIIFILLQLRIRPLINVHVLSPHCPPGFPPPPRSPCRDDRRRRNRWANGPERSEWRAAKKELVYTGTGREVSFLLWRVLGNPSMGNLFVKKDHCRGPTRVRRRRRRDENNNISRLPPPPLSVVTKFSSTIPYLTATPSSTRLNYPVCLVLSVFFLIFIHSTFFFFLSYTYSFVDIPIVFEWLLYLNDDGCYTNKYQ